jgi:hypothetical protein
MMQVYQNEKQIILSLKIKKAKKGLQGNLKAFFQIYLINGIQMAGLPGIPLKLN